MVQKNGNCFLPDAFWVAKSRVNCKTAAPQYEQ